MAKFRKKPVVIEAMLLTKDSVYEIIEWAHQGLTPEANSILIRFDYGLKVRTLKEWLNASYGDWIIKGVHGEFYPCNPDIFEATYERVE